ncbi:hypothetical protein [Pelagibacterium lentulum]|uniref:Uncharacterized protein n=1 Tax=Pelagibacterium lentulum TaxID=2029865 RepID=A0A916R9C3_9HYPH|nr:hypothetical protein [Pelagibacterium lentulum]GGA45896.1 hypothetical protein GCM10011499_14550 [Pelagibacterium lentulum]
MTDRYEAIAVRKYEQNGETKTAFTNIGVAFKMRDRDGYSVRLHAMPAPTDGEFTILLMPPKPRDGQQSSAPRQQSGGGMDDDIPF